MKDFLISSVFFFFFKNKPKYHPLAFTFQYLIYIGPAAAAEFVLLLLLYR
jgi:hypothetical protein